MAKEGRNILAIVFKNFIDSLKPRQFRGNFIGKDHLGNEYFEIPNAGKKRNSRWYEPKNKDEDNFDVQLPAEWEAWLRFRRREPPTELEIAQNLALMKSKKQKAAELDVKYGTGKSVVESPTSFPVYKDYEGSPGKLPDKSDKEN